MVFDHQTSFVHTGLRSYWVPRLVKEDLYIQLLRVRIAGGVAERKENKVEKGHPSNQTSQWCVGDAGSRAIGACQGPCEQKQICIEQVEMIGWGSEEAKVFSVFQAF